MAVTDAAPPLAPPASPRVRRGTRHGRTRRAELFAWLFLLPTVILFGAFTVYPIIASYGYSLMDWNGFDAQKTFVGLANYVEALHDPMFWSSFRVTVIFTVVAVPLQVVLAFVLAMVLNSPIMPWHGFFRTALFLPVVTTTAIIGIVMQFVFDPTSGPINLMLAKLGLVAEPVNFLGSSKTAIWTVVVVYTWKWLGQTIIYWLAALQTVPGDLLEAGAIDGAGRFRRALHITLPLLKPFVVIITLLTLESTLRIFDLVLTMTGGGPFYATQVMEVFIYNTAFAVGIPRLGYASAIAVVFGLFVCLLGLLQLGGIRMAQRARRER